MSTREPLRVLYLDNSFTFGGAINSLLYMLRGFGSSKVNPVIVSGQATEFVQTHIPGVSSYEIRLALPWVHNRWYRRVLTFPLFHLRFVRRIASAIRVMYWFVFKTLPEAIRYTVVGRRHHVALVHLNNNLESQPAGVLAAWLLGVPCVVHSRGFQEPHWTLRIYDRLVSHHIAISTAVKQNLVDAGIRPDKITVVHDGIDLEEFNSGADTSQQRQEFELGADEQTFGLFGRVVGWKGTLEFVRAAQLVLQVMPNARAFIVGDASDGDQAFMVQVENLVRELGVDDRLVLTGYRRDIPALMQMMDVVVLASVEPEPFGMVLIEGMAMQKPIVATRGGGPDDVVLDGRTGLLVPRGDSTALGHAILELLKDPQHAETLGAAGRQRVESSFTKERYAAKVFEIYGQVLPSLVRRSSGI